jgi:hypothetical protein
MIAFVLGGLVVGFLIYLVMSLGAEEEPEVAILTPFVCGGDFFARPETRAYIGETEVVVQPLINYVGGTNYNQKEEG